MCVLCSREVSACIENDGPAIYDSIPIVFNTSFGAFCRRTVPQIFWLEMLETVPWQPLDIYWDAWPTQGSQGVCGYRHWSFVFHSAVYFIGHSGGPREQAPWPQLPLLNCQSITSHWSYPFMPECSTCVYWWGLTTLKQLNRAPPFFSNITCFPCPYGLDSSCVFCVSDGCKW